MNNKVFRRFLYDCPPFISPHILDPNWCQEAEKQFKVFSLNAGIQFLGKIQHIQIICQQLKIIQWNGDFRFFHNGWVCDELWTNHKYQLHWIFQAGILFNCFKGFFVSLSTRDISEKGLFAKDLNELRFFCIQWHLMSIIRWPNTKTRTFITFACSWHFGVQKYPWSQTLT